MNFYSTQILNLVKQLFPKGRAYLIPEADPDTGSVLTDEDDLILETEEGGTLVSEDYTLGAGGIFEKFLKSFSGGGDNATGTLERWRTDSAAILYSILPDNPSFTDGTADPRDNDCNDWEGRLGLIQHGVTSALTPTREERMKMIRTKMAYPGSASPRQSAGYLQTELRAAGFDVYVYENLLGLSPATILGIPVGDAELDDFELDETELDGDWDDGGISIIANYIDKDKDALYDFADNYHGSFIISGDPITTFADVPAVREAEFRQMILRLKPNHMAGFLFVNYV